MKPSYSFFFIYIYIQSTNMSQNIFKSINISQNIFKVDLDVKCIKDIYIGS